MIGAAKVSVLGPYFLDWTEVQGREPVGVRTATRRNSTLGPGLPNSSPFSFPPRAQQCELSLPLTRIKDVPGIGYTIVSGKAWGVQCPTLLKKSHSRSVRLCGGGDSGLRGPVPRDSPGQRTCGRSCLDVGGRSREERRSSRQRLGCGGPLG